MAMSPYCWRLRHGPVRTQRKRADFLAPTFHGAPPFSVLLLGPSGHASKSDTCKNSPLVRSESLRGNINFTTLRLLSTFPKTMKIANAIFLLATLSSAAADEVSCCVLLLRCVMNWSSRSRLPWFMSYHSGDGRCNHGSCGSMCMLSFAYAGVSKVSCSCNRSTAAARVC